MRLINFILIGLVSSVAVSCVSTNKYAACKKSNERLENRNREVVAEDKKTEAMFMADEATIRSLRDRASVEKTDSAQKQAEVANLSEISGIQEDDIAKKNAYISQLEAYVDHKDSFNNALVLNLKSACGDNAGIKIKAEKGTVYVDIADNLLFNSGKYALTEKAKDIISKIAVVLQQQPQLKFTLEGHTDNAPFNDGGLLLDNWDLSVKRATSVVRILQHEYHIAPGRMNASGFGEYAPSMPNTSKEGMAENRTTRIVISPEMEQFYAVHQMVKK